VNGAISTIARTSSDAQRARHWLGAGAAGRAMAPSWRAAVTAETSVAWAEQLTMLEQVLQLWDRVPDPVVSTGTAPCSCAGRCCGMNCCCRARSPTWKKRRG
jgi:hypothetical protein